jgi:hypothetical protein
VRKPLPASQPRKGAETPTDSKPPLSEAGLSLFAAPALENRVLRSLSGHFRPAGGRPPARATSRAGN